MTPCHRGPAPALLAQHGPEIGSTFASRRQVDPTYQFSWPQRDRQRLYDIAHAAVTAITDGHCAYCDGFPLGAVGRDEVDHFRPKSRPEFYHLVCEWDNLFLACTACNFAKLEEWDPALLRPDAPDFRFERYFDYRFDTGELSPNPVASPTDQRCATVTIKILDLNRVDACLNRQKAVKLLLQGLPDDFFGYRYLIPLCRPAA